jgi:hypothetical protein
MNKATAAKIKKIKNFQLSSSSFVNMTKNVITPRAINKKKKRIC